LLNQRKKKKDNFLTVCKKRDKRNLIMLKDNDV